MFAQGRPRTATYPLHRVYGLSQSSIQGLPICLLPWAMASKPLLFGNRALAHGHACAHGHTHTHTHTHQGEGNMSAKVPGAFTGEPSRYVIETGLCFWQHGDPALATCVCVCVCVWYLGNIMTSVLKNGLTWTKTWLGQIPK